MKRVRLHHRAAAIAAFASAAVSILCSTARALPEPQEMLFTREQLDAVREADRGRVPTGLDNCIVVSTGTGQDGTGVDPQLPETFNNRDTSHYARGTTLIWHILVNHDGGTWSQSEISYVGGRSAIAKDYFRDFAPGIAYIRFDHEDEPGFYYYTPTVDYEIIVGGEHWGDWVNDACIALGVVDANGDGYYSDDLTLGLQSWGGWDNVIAVFQVADVHFRANASIERGACQVPFDEPWQTYAHEWGHCYGACDEYEENGGCNGNDCDWICQSWYLNDDVPNGNCEVGGCPSGVCLMKDHYAGGNQAPCAYTVRNWAWVDSNDDGLLDGTVWNDNGVEANMYELFHNGYFIHTNTTWGMVANQRWTSWSAIGVRSRGTANYQLDVYADNNHRWLNASSSMPGQEIDFVVGDFNHNVLSQDHIRLRRVSGTGQYVLAYESGTGMLYPDGVERAGSWANYNVVRCYDVPLIGGETIGFTLDIDTPGLDMGMALFRANGEYWAGRAAAQWEEDDWPAGLSESYVYTVPSDGVYGLVVWSNNEVAGDFSITIGPTMYALAEETPTSSYLDLSLYSFTPNAFSWAVAACRPGASTNLRLQLYEDSHFENRLETSDDYANVEFIAADYNPSKSTDYLRVLRQSGADFKRTEWEQDDEVLVGFETNVWDEDHICKVWDVSLTAGQTYMFRQYESADPIHAGIYLMSSADGDRYVQKSEAEASSISGGADGQWFLYTPAATDWYGFVMTTNDAVSSGSYTVGVGPRISMAPKIAYMYNDEVIWADVPDVNFWSVAAMRAGGGSEGQPNVWACPGFDNDCFETGDDAGPGIRYVVIDGRRAPNQPYYPRFDRTSGTGQQIVMYDNANQQSITFDDPNTVETADGAFSVQTIVNMWDLNVRVAPIRLEISVTPLAPGMDVGLALFSSSATDYILPSYAALASANDHGVDGEERIVVSLSATGIYGLVVVNQNGAPGSYRIEVRNWELSDVADGLEPREPSFRSIGSTPSMGSVPFEIALVERATVDVGVFDVRGRRVRDLAIGTLDPGVHALTWDGRDDAGNWVASGPYFVTMTAGERRHTVKVIRTD